VDKSLLPSNVFSGPPTRDRSSPPCKKKKNLLNDESLEMNVAISRKKIEGQKSRNVFSGPPTREQSSPPCEKEEKL
jgi:hypothetical protein